MPNVDQTETEFQKVLDLVKSETNSKSIQQGLGIQ